VGRRGRRATWSKGAREMLGVWGLGMEMRKQGACRVVGALSYGSGELEGESSPGEMDKNAGRQDDACGREQTRDSEGVRARVRQES